MIRNRRKAISLFFRAGALVASMIAGCYHRVIAGSCVGGPDTYFCQGAADIITDTTMVLSGSPLQVFTNSGFGIDTSVNGGDAIDLTATGGLQFDDAYASIITGYANALKATNNTGGSLSISTSGLVTGGSGGYEGIYALNYGTDLNITTTGNVTGNVTGIEAENNGSGSLSISTSGTVSGGVAGIYASNYGSDLNISLANVTGGHDGIYAINHSTGSLSISTSGTVTGTADDGILAFNHGGPMSMTVGPASLVQGGYTGIDAGSDGQPITITIDGQVRNISGSPSDFAIITDGGPTTVNLNTGGQVTGVISLGGSNDTLNVNGLLTTSQLTINSGSLLGGTGSIFGNVNTYGTISPGNSIGTLTVNGSVDFKPGSSYVVQIGDNGDSDLLQVNGPVSIDGANLKVSLPQALYANGSSWRVIDASGITGSFSTIDLTSYTVSLQQTIQGGSLDLVLVRTPYADFGDTANQKAVAGALEALLPEAQGAMANLLYTMDFAMDPAQLTATLRGLNPEIYTSFAPSGMEIAGAFDRMAAQRQQEFGGDPDVATGKRGRLWSVWGKALGDWLNQDEQRGVSGYTLNTGGAVFGMDRGFGSSARAGLLLGYSNSDLSWDESSSSGSITGKHIGLYGSAFYEGLSWGATLGYTSLDNGAHRFLDTPVSTGSTAGDFTSSVVSATLSGAYDFAFSRLHLNPTASFGYKHLDQNGFTESGSNDFRLQVQGQDADSLTGALGVDLFDLIKTAGWRFRPNAGLNYIHQFEDDAVALTSSFVGYPSASFVVTGQDPVANEIEADLGLTADYNRSFTLYLNYAASLACDRTAQLLSGGLVWWF